MWQGAHDHGIQRVLHIPHHPKLPACPLEAAAWEWLRIRRISSHHVWWLLLCRLGYTELLHQNFFSTMFLKWTTRNILSQSWKKHFCLIHTSSVMWPSTNPGSAMKGICRYCQRQYQRDITLCGPDSINWKPFQQGLAFPEYRDSYPWRCFSSCSWNSSLLVILSSELLVLRPSDLFQNLFHNHPLLYKQIP